MLVMPTMPRSYGNASRMSMAPTLNSSLAISVPLDMALQRRPKIPTLWQLQVMTEAIPPHQVTSHPKSKATRITHMPWRSNSRRRNNVRTPGTMTRVIDERQRLDKATDRAPLRTVPRVRRIGPILIDTRLTRIVFQRDIANRLGGHHRTGMMPHLRHTNRQPAAAFRHLNNTDTRHPRHPRRPRHPGIIDIQEPSLIMDAVNLCHRLHQDFQTGLRIGPRIVLLCKSMAFALTPWLAFSTLGGCFYDDMSYGLIVFFFFFLFEY